MEADSDIPVAGDDDHDAAAVAMVRRVGGDALLLEMIALFEGQSRERLSAARTALAANDADAVRRAFHSLKSSTAQLGARTAARLCADAEALAQDGTLAPLPALVAELEPAVARSLVWLRGHATTAT